jgi:hypothetical protein
VTQEIERFDAADVEHVMVGEVLPPEWPLPAWPFRWGTTEEGIEWAVMQSPMGGLNGYARLPEDHPWREREDTWDFEDVDTHGGITFFDNGWIGFDTAHGGDWWDPDELRAAGLTLSEEQAAFIGRPSYLRSTFMQSAPWNIAALMAEIRSLIDQIIAAGWREAIDP